MPMRFCKRSSYSICKALTACRAEGFSHGSEATGQDKGGDCLYTASPKLLETKIIAELLCHIRLKHCTPASA